MDFDQHWAAEGFSANCGASGLDASCSAASGCSVSRSTCLLRPQTPAGAYSDDSDHLLRPVVWLGAVLQPEHEVRVAVTLRRVLPLPGTAPAYATAVPVVTMWLRRTWQPRARVPLNLRCRSYDWCDRAEHSRSAEAVGAQAPALPVTRRWWTILGAWRRSEGGWSRQHSRKVGGQVPNQPRDGRGSRISLSWDFVVLRRCLRLSAKS